MLNRHQLASRAALAAAPVLLVAAGLVATSAPAAVAEPAPRCGAISCDDDGGSDAESGGGSVSILVWGSGTTAGEEGYEIPAETVMVMPPCYYFDSQVSGKEYYDKVESGFYDNIPTPDREPLPPYPNYQAYKDDTEGSWWLEVCSRGPFEGTDDEWDAYMETWFGEHQPVYVEVGEYPPVPEIPPEVLVQIAYDAMTLPDPEIGWNPRRSGDGATFVNLATWMWLEDGPVQLEVNASAGDNTARVEATMSSMNFSAANAGAVSCDGHGVAWESGASSDCSLTFTRSSASLPGRVATVLAESEWTIEWFANGAPRGPLDPQTTSATFTLPVAEVQTVVTR